MPTFNQSDHIADVLATLKAQTFQNFELIVVFDGGDYDRSMGLVRDHGTIGCGWPKLLVLQLNTGTASALNHGFQLARGRFLTWVSSDNEMHTDYLETLLGFLVEDQSYDAVYSFYTLQPGVIKNGKWMKTGKGGVVGNPYEKDVWITGHGFHLGVAFLFTREFYDLVGPDRGGISHDYDWWMRAEEVGKIGTVKRSLATYRVHDQRTTVLRDDEKDADYWMMVARDRRGL